MHTLRLMSKLIVAITTIVTFCYAPTPAYAAEDPIYTSVWNDQAAGGYDVTAYFSDGKAVKGNAKFTTQYQGADWLFASQQNLDKFLAKPQAYAPQYGGYCAWAVANGDIASGDPQYWAIHDGKLYLNYNKSIQQKWSLDKPGRIVSADKNWPSVLR